MEVQNLEEVLLPELNDAFAKEKLNAPTSAEFKAMVEQSIRAQESQFLEMQREQKLLEEIKNRTKADIAPELLDEEVSQLIGDWQRQVEEQGTKPEDWLKAQNKTADQMMEEFRKQGADRILLRLGITKIIEDRKVELTDEERRDAVEEALQNVPPEQMVGTKEYYKIGGEGYTQLMWQMLVRKALATF